MTMDVRSCSMYGMALLAVEALQFVPWAGKSYSQTSEQSD